MNYNLHPIFVHFPIAFLFVYSLIRSLPLNRWLPKIAWKHIELGTLVVGMLGLFASLVTGEVAESLTRPPRSLVNAHSDFATFTVIIYSVLLAGEILNWLNTRYSSNQSIKPFFKQLFSLGKILSGNVVGITLAILGLIAITVTGLLGGVMVYGTTADPLAPIVLSLLGISL